MGEAFYGQGRSRHSFRFQGFPILRTRFFVTVPIRSTPPDASQRRLTDLHLGDSTDQEPDLKTFLKEF